MNTFSDPERVVEQGDFFPGQEVADFGVGSGAYTMAIARKIAGDSKSRVFAIDVQRNLLDRVATEAETEHLDSVNVVWGDLETIGGSRLKDESVSAVLIANTLFQLEDKKTTLKEAWRVLRPDGRLIIVDWSESFGNIGPKEDHVVTETAAKALAEEAGFTFDRSLNAGEHHYGFMSRKN